MSSNPTHTIQHCVIKWLTTDQWFSPGTSVSLINKTTRHEIDEILLIVALNTITLNHMLFWNRRHSEAYSYNSDIRIILFLTFLQNGRMCPRFQQKRTIEYGWRVLWLISSLIHCENYVSVKTFWYTCYSYFMFNNWFQIIDDLFILISHEDHQFILDVYQ